MSLRLADVRFSFNDGPVLRGINLEVCPSEVVALLGPSGCGKTTLLRVMAGLVRPAAGEVTLDGVPLRKATATIGLIFQTQTLFPWLSVRGNVEFGMHNHDNVHSAADSLLASVGMAGSGDSLPAKLSVGMGQRVSLARALATEPKYLLADEPFGAVDALGRLELQSLLATVAAERTLGLAVVTHDMSEAVALADRIIVLSRRPARIIHEYAVKSSRPRIENGVQSEEMLKEVHTLATLCRELLA